MRRRVAGKAAASAGVAVTWRLSGASGDDTWMLSAGSRSFTSRKMPCLSVALPKSQSMTSVMAAEWSALKAAPAHISWMCSGLPTNAPMAAPTPRRTPAAAQQRHIQPPP